jgi:integrase/recombinase XerD
VRPICDQIASPFRVLVTIRLYQKKKNLRPDGTAPIYFVLSKGGKRKLISTGRYVKPLHFNNKTGLVLRGSDNSIKLNAYFKRQMTKIDDLVIDFIHQGKEPTLEIIDKLFRNENSNDFISFAYSELNLQRSVLSPKTFVGYKDRLDSLRKIKAEIPFNSIDHTFLLNLRYLLASKRKVNGYYQDFATIRKFYRIAVLKGLAKGDPFKNFKLEKEDTVRSWLTKDEIGKLHALLKDTVVTDAVKNTLRHFLFSCFCGIRFGDNLRFDASNLVDGRIELKTRKTGKQIVVPFNEKMKELIPHVLQRPLKTSNSRVNADLKTCMAAAGISKHITFHCSRHTFAINCIMAGVDIITVRDWLGHRSVTTTEAYAKIAAQYKDESMKKIDGFFA